MKMKKDYLKEYDAAAEADKYPLVQQWMKKEPLPFFKQLREERPILVTPECTLIALFTDVRDCLQMPKIFTVDLYKPKMGVTDTEEGYLMAHEDDALHYREKSIMQVMLNRDDLPAVREGIKQSAQKILDNANGRLDIVDNYCRMVPAIMVQDYFGLDGINPKKLLKWSFWNQYNTPSLSFSCYGSSALSLPTSQSFTASQATYFAQASCFERYCVSHNLHLEK